MTTQPEYMTTATGAIDYASYDRRAREIRSQDAWRAISAFGNALKSIAFLFTAHKPTNSTVKARFPRSAPMRSPKPRGVHSKGPNAEAGTCAYEKGAS